MVRNLQRTNLVKNWLKYICNIISNFKLISKRFCDVAITMFALHSSFWSTFRLRSKGVTLEVRSYKCRYRLSGSFTMVAIHFKWLSIHYHLEELVQHNLMTIQMTEDWSWMDIFAMFRPYSYQKSSCSVVVITFPLHGKGPAFEPRHELSVDIDVNHPFARILGQNLLKWARYRSFGHLEYLWCKELGAGGGDVTSSIGWSVAFICTYQRVDILRFGYGSRFSSDKHVDKVCEYSNVGNEFTRSLWHHSFWLQDTVKAIDAGRTVHTYTCGQNSIAMSSTKTVEHTVRCIRKRLTIVMERSSNTKVKSSLTLHVVVTQ